MTTEPKFLYTLDRGAAHALECNLPVQLWYADDDHFAEVFFFRDMVLHAEVDGLYGVAAVVAMFTSGLQFAMNVGVWPRECTITTSWGTARIEAELERARHHHARHDDAASERIAER